MAAINEEAAPLVRQVSAKARRALDALGEDLLCPVTRGLLVDPVVADDGFTYERAAITQWIASEVAAGRVFPKSPKTNLPMGTEMRSNTLAMVMIQTYVDSGQVLDEVVADWRESRSRVVEAATAAHQALGQTAHDRPGVHEALAQDIAGRPGAAGGTIRRGSTVMIRPGTAIARTNKCRSNALSFFKACVYLFCSLYAVNVMDAWLAWYVNAPWCEMQRVCTATRELRSFHIINDTYDNTVAYHSIRFDSIRALDSIRFDTSIRDTASRSTWPPSAPMMPICAPSMQGGCVIYYATLLSLLANYLLRWWLPFNTVYNIFYAASTPRLRHFDAGRSGVVMRRYHGFMGFASERGGCVDVKAMGRVAVGIDVRDLEMIHHTEIGAIVPGSIVSLRPTADPFADNPQRHPHLGLILTGAVIGIQFYGYLFMLTGLVTGLMTDDTFSKSGIFVDDDAGIAATMIDVFFIQRIQRPDAAANAFQNVFSAFCWLLLAFFYGWTCFFVVIYPINLAVYGWLRWTTNQDIEWRDYQARYRNYVPGQIAVVLRRYGWMGSSRHGARADILRGGKVVSGVDVLDLQHQMTL